MSQAGNGMGTWNTCEIPPPTLTLLVDNINNVCVFLRLHLKYSLASRHGIANISRFSILGNFFLIFGQTVPTKFSAFFCLL